MVYQNRRNFHRTKGNKAQAHRMMRRHFPASKYAYQAAAAYRMVKRLKDAVNVEYKFVDQIFFDVNDNDATLTILNTIAQGDTDNTRDGDSLKLQNFIIRGSVTGAVSDTIRFILFHDKQNVIANPSDYMATSEVSSVFQPKNYDNRFRSKVLWDRTISVDPGNQSKHFSKVVPLNFHTQYNSGTSTINTGALKLLVISSPAVGTTTFSGVTRVTYTDN